MTESERAYYTRRAPEYDDFYLGTGLYAARARPGWHEELEVLQSVLAALPPRRVLDVACGTGFLTRHLSGNVMGTDQSHAMLTMAHARLPQVPLVQADAFRLPFPANSFDLVFTGHFYGHLLEPNDFLKEARRVAPSLLVVDAAWRAEVPAESMQERVLNDGSHHTVYKRYFTPERMLGELGGGTVLHAGRWFVAIAAGI